MFKKKTDEISVSYPNELLEETQVEGVIISPIYKEMGFSLISSYENDEYTLRIYNLHLNEGDANYEVTHELEAFSFKSRYDLDLFKDRIPQMSALEILMAMNPMPTTTYEN